MDGEVLGLLVKELASVSTGAEVAVAEVVDEVVDEVVMTEVSYDEVVDDCMLGLVVRFVLITLPFASIRSPSPLSQHPLFSYPQQIVSSSHHVNTVPAASQPITPPSTLVRPVTTV